MLYYMRKLLLLATITVFLAACGEPHDHDHSHDEDHHNAIQEAADRVDTNHDDHKEHDNHAESDHDQNDDHDDHDGEDVRQLGSHVHGEAMLALALDGSTLVIELETPLQNLLGFEHAPKTDAQMARLAVVETALALPSNLFTFNSDAGCEAVTSDPVKLFADIDDHHDDGHDNGHSEALLDYEFTCKSPDALNEMRTELFTLFPELSGLETVFLGPSTQIQSILSSNRNMMKLTK